MFVFLLSIQYLHIIFLSLKKNSPCDQVHNNEEIRGVDPLDKERSPLATVSTSGPPEYSEQIDFDASIAMAAVDFEQTGTAIIYYAPMFILFMMIKSIFRYHQVMI